MLINWLGRVRVVFLVLVRVGGISNRLVDRLRVKGLVCKWLKWGMGVLFYDWVGWNV